MVNKTDHFLASLYIFLFLKQLWKINPFKAPPQDFIPAKIIQNVTAPSRSSSISVNKGSFAEDLFSPRPDRYPRIPLVFPHLIRSGQAQNAAYSLRDPPLPQRSFLWLAPRSSVAEISASLCAYPALLMIRLGAKRITSGQGDVMTWPESPSPSF